MTLKDRFCVVCGVKFGTNISIGRRRKYCDKKKCRKVKEDRDYKRHLLYKRKYRYMLRRKMLLDRVEMHNKLIDGLSDEIDLCNKKHVKVRRFLGRKT